MDQNTMYAAVNTKIASMFGKLLNDEDYRNLLSLKNSQEIAQYLKANTYYGEFLKDKDPLKMHRGDIERLLKESLVVYMDKLINYFHGEYRSFLKSFYMKYEIYDLKRVARIIHIDKDFDNIKESLVFAGKYKYIDIDRIVKAKSIMELIQALEGTYYYPYLKNLIDGNTKENLYRLEMTLDKIYFIVLGEKLKKLNKKDQRVFIDLYGNYIDMLNIQWIYRGKEYYSLSPEEIFNYTVDRGNRFNYKNIKEFCYAKDVGEFIGKIRNTSYGFMFKENKNEDIFMERRMNRFMYFKLKGAKQKLKLDISMLLAYLELKEFEIRDIITITEGVRYKMDGEEIKKYLIKAI